MMLPSTIQKIIKEMVEVREGKVMAVVENNLKEKWDELVKMAVFGSAEEQPAARWVIREVGRFIGVKPGSINELYLARGRGEVAANFTVPAINVRGMAYDTARAVFNTAKKNKVGLLIVEIARSEIGYTDQSPDEYAAVMLGAAIREGWRGSLPIQGDHFQAKEAGPGQPKEGELEAIKKMTREAIEAGFYNIDIDMSTLVDLAKPSEPQQQAPNVKYSLEMMQFVREIEPEGITVSLGGEIGHIGGKNSTVAEFEAYIKGVKAGLKPEMAGLSKISVATGTHHGGVVLADGSLAQVDVDFRVLADISKACRSYGLAGSVQHGASTLPEKYFKEFVRSEAVEVHLATEFQNIIMDHPRFPKELLEQMYLWLDEEKSDERKDGQTDEQFHYSLRKKVWGKFKKECWEIAEELREEIRKALENKFEFLFKELQVVNTEELAKKWL